MCILRLSVTLMECILCLKLVECILKECTVCHKLMEDVWQCPKETDDRGSVTYALN